MESSYGQCIRYIENLHRQKGRILIAIDGKSGSGKTTMAQKLAERYQASLYHMDDFFLQPFQRTPERLAEVGGNVDYERFLREVLVPLASGEEFEYGIFDCRQQKITERRKGGTGQIQIVEGSYSQHPYFGRYYDVAICLSIEDAKQRERIRRRNGEAMSQRFAEEWIPKENAYLEKFHIMEQADFFLDGNGEETEG